MNKNNMKHIYKFASLFVLTGLVGLYTQCVPETQKIDMKEGSTYHAPAPSQDTGEILMALEVSEGVRNYEEIFATYSALTGVPATNGNVRNVFSEVKVSLPTDNDMKSFLSGHQVAITKLAAEFCNEMITSSTLRIKLWPELNYQALPSVAFDQAKKDLLANNTMDLFWGPVVSAEEKAEMRIVLSDLIDDLVVGEFNSTLTTRQVVKSVCTAALSSMHVTMK